MSTTEGINRRKIVKGTAWAAPAIVATTTIPAYAASPQPVLTSSTHFGWGNTISSNVPNYSCGGRAQIQIRQDSTSYLRVTGLTTGTTLSNLKMSVWLPVQAGTTFTRVSGSSSCWSVPVATGITTVRNGYTFREYVSTYGCAMNVTSSTWTQPTASNFNFISSCQTSSTLPTTTYHYTQQVTVKAPSGAIYTPTKDNGWSNTML